MVANCAVTAGATGMCGATRLAGGSTASTPEVSVLLELFNECPAELGDEYPVACIVDYAVVCVCVLTRRRWMSEGEHGALVTYVVGRKLFADDSPVDVGRKVLSSN